jgi:hypothetical protein
MYQEMMEVQGAPKQIHRQNHRRRVVVMPLRGAHKQQWDHPSLPLPDDGFRKFAQK